jgi:hypothetical protein
MEHKELLKSLKNNKPYEAPKWCGLICDTCMSVIYYEHKISKEYCSDCIYNLHKEQSHE